MYGRRRSSRPNLEAHQTIRADDKVRRTSRKVRRVDEEVKEHGARAPRGAEVPRFRRCKL